MSCDTCRDLLNEALNLAVRSDQFEEQHRGRARQAKGRAFYGADVNLPAFLTEKNIKDFIHKDLYVTSISDAAKMGESGTLGEVRHGVCCWLPSTGPYPSWEERGGGRQYQLNTLSSIHLRNISNAMLASFELPPLTE